MISRCDCWQLSLSSFAFSLRFRYGDALPALHMEHGGGHWKDLTEQARRGTEEIWDV